jgi:hypothetical protein
MVGCAPKRSQKATNYMYRTLGRTLQLNFCDSDICCNANQGFWFSASPVSIHAIAPNPIPCARNSFWHHLTPSRCISHKLPYLVEDSLPSGSPIHRNEDSSSLQRNPIHRLQPWNIEPVFLTAVEAVVPVEMQQKPLRSEHRSSPVIHTRIAIFAQYAILLKVGSLLCFV